jgi:hypothetical protein
VITFPFVITPSRVVETPARPELTHTAVAVCHLLKTHLTTFNQSNSDRHAPVADSVQSVLQYALPQQARATAEQPPLELTQIL